MCDHLVQRIDLKVLFLAALLAGAAVPARAQATIPFDHIHLNEPAAEASQWWEKNIPGGRRITEAPNRIMYGAVRLMFLGPRRISVLAAEILHCAGVRDGIGSEILDAGHDRPQRNHP